MLDLSLVLPTAVSLLSLLLLYKQFKLYTFWSSRGVKGPTPWPFIGTNIYYLFKDRVILDQEYRNKYGHVYGLYEGRQPVLRVTDNKLLQYVYIKNFSSFSERNNKSVHGDNSRRWLFWSETELWSNQRALIAPMFTSLKLKTMFNTLVDCANKFSEEFNSRLKKTTRELLGDNEADEIERAKILAKASNEATLSKDELMSFALDTIASTFFSLKLDTYKDKTSEFYKRAFAFSQFEVHHFIAWLLTPNFICRYFKWDLVTFSKFEYFDKLSKSIVEKRRNEKSDKRHNDVIQSLLEAKIPTQREAIYSQLDDHEAHYNDNMKHDVMDRDYAKQAESVKFRQFDDLEIVAQMTFFFIAGFETTSSSLSFIFYELGREQDYQQEVYEELVTNLSDDFNYTDVLSLKKLDAFICEALRIHAPVTENNRKVTCKQGVVLPTEPPIHLPYDVVVSIPALVVQREPEYWKDPLKFDPTRFYPENRANMKTCTYMPFGLGPRNCAGMRFALMNLKLFVALCLMKYKVMPKRDQDRYPPEYKRHAFFLQLEDTNFKMMPRAQATY